MRWRPRCLAGCVEHKPDRRSKGVCDEINVRTVERTLTQFQGEVIPDNHPVIPQLKGLFGDHTFFLDSHGLNIVEPEAAGSGAQSAKVRLADRRSSQLDVLASTSAGRDDMAVFVTFLERTSAAERQCQSA
jgi:hypothetical protein